MMRDYRADFRVEEVKLIEMLKEQEALEVKVARQKKRLAALAELCDESDLADQPVDLDLGGLSDVCRTAMRASRKEWLTIAEIQEAIKELGFPIHKYTALAASVTTTVNRLVDAGEVIQEKHVGGANEYKWIGKGRIALLKEGERLIGRSSKK